MPRSARRLGLVTILAASLAASPARAHTVLVEAEAFDDVGGWVIDQQFMDEMGSPFVLAHGLGVPVKDATAAVTLPAAGTYRVWVRTRDWVAHTKAPGTAGRFRVLVGGRPLEPIFGTKGREWAWHDGGTVKIAARKTTIALKDLTGFEGRCDAIVLSDEKGFVPPDERKALGAFRKRALGLPVEPAAAGKFDLVVVGGGVAGTCAAVSAARLGLRVALIQDRPVLGGNNSSEVRVWRGGGTNLAPWPRIGGLVREMGPRAKGSPGAAAEFGDKTKLQLVRGEKNVRLLLSYHAFAVKAERGRIASVDARHVIDGNEVRVAGRWFADCTGDGTIGFLAGADWEMTRKGHMGRSNMWRVVDTGKPQPFPRCPWAHDMTGKPCPTKLNQLGRWFWESGFDRDPIAEGEHIRDNNFRGMYGVWDHLKNVRKLYPNHRLEWAAFIGGKRESRRLLGDVILNKGHVLSGREFPDGCVPSTWSIDLHLPDPRYAKGFEKDEFLSKAHYTRFKGPYWVPYRCLYSRNVANLFMAGRDVSVTHEALGTVRVMRTTGMMGEIVGMAASVCKKRSCDPREVYEQYLDELKQRMAEGVGRGVPPPAAANAPAKLDPPKWLAAAGANLARSAALTVSSCLDKATYPPKNINDGRIGLPDNRNRWVSARSAPPHHVVLTWPTPQTISAARIITGWVQGRRLTAPIGDFALQVPDGDGWKDIPGAKVSGNTRFDWHAAFPPVTTGRLRLLVTATHVNAARIWEVELYHLKKTPADK